MKPMTVTTNIVCLGLSLMATYLTGCATTAANQRYDSPIPVYVDLTAPAPQAVLNQPNAIGADAAVTQK